MSVGQSNHINFSISHAKQTFKLIELPSELLTRLESNPPPTLIITSSPIATNTLHAPQGPALLIHETKKYKLRSKNSSNTILLFQPSSANPDLIDSPHEFNSVTAVAQCDETIELLLVEEEPEIDSKKVNKWHEKFAKSRDAKKD